MYSNILVALDASIEPARMAVDLARLTGAKLTALFVLDDGWNTFTGSDWLSGSGSRADYLEYARDHEFMERDRVLARFAGVAGDLPAVVKTPTGFILEELLKELTMGGYDLLVIGLPFARGLEKYRDAPEKLIKKAPCSVLFVREAA